MQDGTSTQQGQRVWVNYKGSLPDGTVFDDNETGEPFTFVLGTNAVMRGFEQTVQSMSVGDECTVTIPCGDAYGEYDDSAVLRIPLVVIPRGEELKAGAMVNMFSPRACRPAPAKVKRIANGIADIDFNHLLAGQDVTYWIRLVGIGKRPQ